MTLKEEIGLQPDNRVMDLVDQVRRAMAPKLKAMDDLADALRDFESFFRLEGLHNASYPQGSAISGAVPVPRKELLVSGFSSRQGRPQHQ